MEDGSKPDGEPIGRRILAGLTKIAIALKSRAWDAGTLRGISPTQAQILTQLHFHRKSRVTVTGRELHFDVMTTDEGTALRLAREYLANLGDPDVPVSTEECQFCHSEPLAMFHAEQQRTFLANGGFIVSLGAKTDCPRSNRKPRLAEQAYEAARPTRLGCGTP